jgi:hypothetical protein
VAQGAAASREEDEGAPRVSERGRREEMARLLGPGRPVRVSVFFLFFSSFLFYLKI